MKTLTLVLATALIAALAAFGQTANTPAAQSGCASTSLPQGAGYICFPAGASVLVTTTPAANVAAPAAAATAPWWVWPLVALVVVVILAYLWDNRNRNAVVANGNAQQALGMGQVPIQYQPDPIVVRSVHYVQGGPVPTFPQQYGGGYYPQQQPQQQAPPPPPAGWTCTNHHNNPAVAAFCAVCGVARP